MIAFNLAVARRTECGSCGSPWLTTILDLGRTPLADSFPAGKYDIETQYPLGLAVCSKCWLVQSTEIVDDSVLFGADYGFSTGASPSLRTYFGEYAAWAERLFRPEYVVEIGSNDGTLLSNFSCKVLGVDPCGPADKASVPTINAPFSTHIAEDIASDGLPDLIIANNVVAHASDLNDLLGGIATLMSPSSIAVIEFQALPDMLVGNLFDNVYHEHRFHFSLASFGRAIARHGLAINRYIHTPQQGGSIRAMVYRSNGWGHVEAREEAWLDSMAAYSTLQARVDWIAARLFALTLQRKEIGPVHGYGATAKSTTLLNYANLGGLIDHVEDLTPAKIGRYTPGTKIPIVAPGDQKPPTYLLLAWNYASDILRREIDYITNGGKFIVPLPVPVLL